MGGHPEPGAEESRGGADIARGLEREALSLGFSLIGVSDVRTSAHADFYRGWLRDAHHGEMAYLARSDAVARRADLSLTMADATSCIVVAHEYDQPDPPGLPGDPSRAVFARYARGADYHDVVKGKLERLLAWLDARLEGGVRGRAYVDTGPILERELAQRAGLGWFGRNTMLISPGRGSYFFIGLLLVDVRLPGTAPFTEDRCGTCRACLDACPTGALLGRDASGAPVMDARRCISYLTIELRGPIPRGLRPLVGNRVFGCDICQEVCPWNEQFSRPSQEASSAPTDLTDGPTLVALAETLLEADEGAFRKLFSRSAVRRAKRAGLLRNVCVALGNWGDPGALQPLTRATGDAEALVRGHAAWALGAIGGDDARRALRAVLESEEDAWVREEAEAALAEATPGR